MTASPAYLPLDDHEESGREVNYSLARTQYYSKLNLAAKINRSRFRHFKTADVGVPASTDGQEKVDISDALSIASKRDVVSAFVSEVEWDGYVTEVSTEKVSGVLTPVGLGSSKDRSIVDIPMKQVAETDRSLVVSGAMFRLAVGYNLVRTTPKSGKKGGSVSGTRKNAVRIYFRRSAEKTENSLEWIRDGVEKLYHKSKESTLAG